MTNQVTDFHRVFYAKVEQRLSRFTPLMQVICGPRQVGKTTAVKQFLATIPDRSLYLSFDNPGPNPHEVIRFEWRRLHHIHGHKVIVLDEIQNVPHWAPLLKELYDEARPHGELSVAILGSSALELLLRGEESLFGRYEVIRAPHWSPAEMRRCFGWDLNTFLKFGGYPILSAMCDESKDCFQRCQSFMQDAIIEPVLTRDIFTLQNVLNTGLFRQIVKVALALPCRDISYAKLGGQISEKGSLATIKNYLELLEKAFLVKLLSRYSGSKIRKRTSAPKIIPLAPALVHAFCDARQIDRDPRWFGDVFEAAVIARLAESRAEIYYWSDSKVDVDLVIEDPEFLCAVEIKSNDSLDYKGLRVFQSHYPKSKILALNRARGEEILYADNPRELIAEWVGR